MEPGLQRSQYKTNIDNVLTTTRPKEAHPNTEQSFVDAKMPTNGAAVKDVEDQTAEAGRHDNQKEGVAGLQALSDNKAPVMQAQVVVPSKLLEGWV